MAEPSLSGWTPIQLVRSPLSAGGVAVHWAPLGIWRWTEPFFEQSVDQIFRSSPRALLLRRFTGLDDWTVQPGDHPILAPSGFIFHVTRCGSTLVSQALAALEDALVASEPRPLSRLLSLPEADPALRRQRLRAFVQAFGQPRAAAERRFFIKFEGIDSLDLFFIRQTFPDVPWVFLYRDPVEVLASNLDYYSEVFTPGVVPPDRLGHGDDPSALLALPPVEYAAALLARYYAAGLENADAPGGLLLNYDELADAIPTRLARHFGLDLSEEQVSRMQSTLRFYSKAPGQQFLFEDDRADKQRRASAAARVAADKWIVPFYEALERSRRRQPSTLNTPTPP